MMYGAGAGMTENRLLRLFTSSSNLYHPKEEIFQVGQVVAVTV
jgi:hypothetical protein